MTFPQNQKTQQANLYCITFKLSLHQNKTKIIFMIYPFDDLSDSIYVPFQKRTSLVYFRTDMFVKMYDQIVFTDDLYECHAFHIYWCKHMYMTIGGYDV